MLRPARRKKNRVDISPVKMETATHQSEHGIIYLLISILWKSTLRTLSVFPWSSQSKAHGFFLNTFLSLRILTDLFHDNKMTLGFSISKSAKSYVINSSLDPFLSMISGRFNRPFALRRFVRRFSPSSLVCRNADRWTCIFFSPIPYESMMRLI